MYRTSNWKEKIKLLLTILVPILITQLGLYAMNFFDTVMSGHASASDLAGVAIGSSLWAPVFTGINGILIALSPIVAQLVGAQKKKDIPEAVRQGIYLSILLALIVAAVGSVLLDPILNRMKLDSDVQHIAKYYLIAIGSGIIPLFVYNILRNFVDALGQTRMTMLITLISLPLNVVFNYLFIFGKLGLPALGGVGAGIASALTYLVSSIISIFIVHKVQPFSEFKILSGWKRPSLSAWWEQLKIGVPIGFAIFFEVSIFAAVTLFMSKYNTTTIAAHQAAINFASFLYMIPLSISMALTITVGYEAGGKRYQDARQYGIIGISIAVFMAIFSGAILYIFAKPVAELYSNNSAVIQLAQNFLFYAIFYQLSDAFGAPIQGILRGHKDVNVTLIMAFISYWIIGLPSGYIMANYSTLGPYGYWLGLIIGLAVGAVTLFTRLIFIQRKKYNFGSKTTLK